MVMTYGFWVPLVLLGFLGFFVIKDYNWLCFLLFMVIWIVTMIVSKVVSKKTFM